MLPLSDDNPRLRPAIGTWAILVGCIAVFFAFSVFDGPWYTFQLDVPAMMALFNTYGFVSARFFADPMAGEFPQAAAIFTSMFLHGGILHLAGNMLYLFIFADNVEDGMGTIRFLIFYLLCGVVAALCQAYASPDSFIPMVGASGAISGVLGAYLFMFPTARVLVLVPFLIVQVPAAVVLVLYIAVQIYSGLTVSADEPGVAFWAHIGGFAAGVLLHPFFKVNRFRRA